MVINSDYLKSHFWIVIHFYITISSRLPDIWGTISKRSERSRKFCASETVGALWLGYFDLQKMNFSPKENDLIGGGCAVVQILMKR